MRVIRKIGFFSLFVAAALFAQNATATILPISSYADGHWQGSRFYNIEVISGSFLRGRVDFAVYDTVDYSGEFISVEVENEFEGRYIYAYQIFNDYPVSEEAVAYFAVFGIDEEGEPSGVPLDVYEDSIDSVEDTPDSGVDSTWEHFTESNLKAVWVFAGGVLIASEHSYFLVFSSDLAPVPGDYTISSGEFPASEIPEPATIALLGIGGALTICARRRKSV